MTRRGIESLGVVHDLANVTVLDHADLATDRVTGPADLLATDPVTGHAKDHAEIGRETGGGGRKIGVDPDQGSEKDQDIESLQTTLRSNFLKVLIILATHFYNELYCRLVINYEYQAKYLIRSFYTD